MFNTSKVRTALRAFTPTLVSPGEKTRQAAVAIILREAPMDSAEQTEVLFIQRAERPGDPWSGQMAFPGGHREDSDSSLQAAAMRETHEEIGLSLANADYLGALNHQQAQPRGRVLNMLIAPHVFVTQDTPNFTPNREVAEVVWAPLPTLASNTLHDTETLKMAGKPTIFNGYRLRGGHFVWGLTYRILKSFFTAVDSKWQPPMEID
mgnify:FL=1